MTASEAEFHSAGKLPAESTHTLSGVIDMTDQTQQAGGIAKPTAKSAAKAKRAAKMAAKKQGAKVARSQKLDSTEMKRLGLDPKPYGKSSKAS